MIALRGLIARRLALRLIEHWGDRALSVAGLTMVVLGLILVLSAPKRREVPFMGKIKAILGHARRAIAYLSGHKAELDTLRHALADAHAYNRALVAEVVALKARIAGDLAGDGAK